MPLSENEYRKEIHLPKEVKNDLIKQAIDEGYNSPKQMIEKKIIDSVKEYKKNK